MSQKKPHLSDAGDLTALAKKIARLIQHELDMPEMPALVVTFTHPPDYQQTHWVSNCRSSDALILNESTTHAIRNFVGSQNLN